MRSLFVLLFTCFLFGSVLLAQGTASDDALYDKIRVAIAGDRDAGGAPIEVVVKNGVVTLTGKVDSERIKTKAEKIAKKAKGVKKVDNQLTIGRTH